jgi:hypothetical protein
VHEWVFFRIGGEIAISSIFFKELAKTHFSHQFQQKNTLHAPHFRKNGSQNILKNISTIDIVYGILNYRKRNFRKKAKTT